MGSFEDQVVLITGAGSNRGRSIAQAFASQGAIVAANDLTPINLDQTIQQITASGGRAREYIFDIAKKMPLQALLEQVMDDWGQLDICVHCAQVMPRANLLDMDEWDWRRTVDVNLSSAFFLMQSAGRIMRQQGHGQIVCVINAPEDDLFQNGFSAVEASKTGLASLIRSAAHELGEFQISVSGVIAGKFGEVVLRAYPKLIIPSAIQDVGQAVINACQLNPDAIHGKFILLEG